MTEKGKRAHLIFGGWGGYWEGEVEEDSTWKNPSLSMENGGAERPCWRLLTRGRREAGSCSAHPRITWEG